MSLVGPMLFDHRDFWGDEAVQMMTATEVYAYIRLMGREWENGSIPADPAKIAALLTEGPRHFTVNDVVGDGTLDAPEMGTLWAALRGCYRPLMGDPSRLIQPRVHQEREEWIAKREGASKWGKAGAEKRWKRRNTKDLPGDRPPNGPPSGGSNGPPSGPPNASSPSPLPLPVPIPEEDPPLTPPGGDDEKKPPAKRAPKIPRDVTAERAKKILEIPRELEAIGLDGELLAKRIRTARVLKHVETWQGELDRLAPLVAECGADAVLETWTDATNGEWQGCTPEFVRRKANGKGSPDKPRGRFSQPHTIAPGSSGKDHGIDY